MPKIQEKFCPFVNETIFTLDTPKKTLVFKFFFVFKNLAQNNNTFFLSHLSLSKEDYDEDDEDEDEEEEKRQRRRRRRRRSRRDDDAYRVSSPRAL